MRRFKNLVIGGIQTKVFNLILITVVLLTAVFIMVSQYQSGMLSRLVADTSARQQTATDETMITVMQATVEQAMGSSNELESYIADQVFNDLLTRVRMLQNYAGKLFSDPGAYPRARADGPDPARDGEIYAQLIPAPGVDLSDPDLSDRIGLIADMSDMMTLLFGANEDTNSCFVALPDGVFLVTDDRAASKFDDQGQAVEYDPRTRPWYIQAVEAGDLIFTDVEIDAFTGDIGIVCAAPVYAGGELVAVVGSDLFLTSMRDAVQSSDQNGSFICVVNQYGHVVFSPHETGSLRVLATDEAADLRQSDNQALAQMVTDALEESTGMRVVEMDGSAYYMIGAPMKTLGWALISVCSQEAAAQPAALLRDSYDQIQLESAETYRGNIALSKRTAVILLIGAALLMLAGALILGKRIVAPLNGITRRIASLRDGDLEFKMEDRYRTGDEVQELAESFAALSHKTVTYMENVRQVTAEKERIGAELSLATRIQAAMLPHVFPPFPDRREFDIYGTMNPAKEVGGDFFDYFLIDSDHLCMVIADVSGKGVPAALFMMATKIILQSVAMMGKPPAEILKKTNEAICSNNEAQMFVSVWLGILEISTGRLTAANAGHEYPAICRPGSRYELIKDKHGLVIGAMDTVSYREYEMTLESGTRLFVYTDGVPEATDASDELFGLDRMIAALNEDPGAAPKDVLSHVRSAVDRFVGEAKQFDDLTMLCLEYKGKGGDSQ